MINRIDQKFKALKQAKQKAFIAFITAGFPDLMTTEKLVPALEHAGVDIIELGIPFSDPLADGATIQASSHAALAKGVSLTKIFAAVKRIRKVSSIPIAFMSYYNPIFAYGEEKFIMACQEAGVDGVIIPDLPPEEAINLRKLAIKHDISTVFFIAPTTTDKRLKDNVNASTGFVYYVSLTGVTGVKQAIASSVVKDIKRAKRYTQKPICAGFGINNAAQAKEIAKIADGIIVGSAIIKEIQRREGKKSLVQEVSSFAHQLVKAIK